MFSPAYLQTEQNTAGWLWYVLLAIVLLVLIIWWFSRRQGEGVETPRAATVQSGADDLTKLEGIGPKVAKVLGEAGITTFQGLARADAAKVQQALDAAGLQMMNPEGWIEQADLAAKGDWEGLQRLQGELKGGRKK